MTQQIINAIRIMNKNRIFRFLASVKFSVPTMLAIIIAVAVGTLYESRYNSQVASILVYRAWWFIALLGFLWINILFSTLSRIPWKKHHVGFVIIHAGLLTLLVGGVLTAFLGTDGTLRVIEGQSGRQVMLSSLVLKAQSAAGATYSYDVDRALSRRDADQLGLGDLRSRTGLIVEKYEPFVSVDQAFSSEPGSGNGTAVTFNLQSAMFNVTDWLNTKEKPETRMGPATIRIVSDRARTRDNAPPRTDRGVIIKDAKSGSVLARLSLAKLRKAGATLHGVRIRVVRVLEQGVVSNGKLVEGGTPGANPALELRLESGKKSLREIAFSKFPGFSLNPKGTFGLHVEYAPGDSANAGTPESGFGGAGNVIEFHLRAPNSKQLEVELRKNGTRVLSKVVHEGETIQTPWMGIKITVTSIVPNASPHEKLAPIDLPTRSPLPPSAIYVVPEGSASGKGSWIAEGEARSFQTSMGEFDVYFGPDSVDLPFSLSLEKFLKVDYPGTETPMSFESAVKINGEGESVEIRMNEPLKRDGYVLYQASYEQGPGMPTASIFSVNRDPGRMIKYFGAIIMIVGIAIFTIMRSRYYPSRPRKAVRA